jgi:hypothetical protein
MKTEWRAPGDGKMNYVVLGGDGVTIGSYSSPEELTDNAITIAYDKFLAGEWQDDVLKNMGKEILEEILETIGGSGLAHP